MTLTNVEDATIEKALVFYQQHILSERQRHESRFPKNGKSPASPADALRDEAYDCELRIITNILEARHNNLGTISQDFTESKSSAATVRQAAKLDDFDTEPYINPFTGQYVVPETSSISGPSNSGSISDGWGMIEVAKSRKMIDEPLLQEDSGSCVLEASSKSAATKAGDSIGQTRPRGSKSSVIKRKPVNPQLTNPRPNPVAPAFETFSPLSSPEICLSATASTSLSSEVTSATITQSHGQNYTSGSPKTLETSSSRPRSLEGETVPENPALKPPQAERQIQRSAGPSNDQETPWTSLTRPTTDTATAAVPNAAPLTQEPSRQPANWRHPISAFEKPVTPRSVESRQGQESPWQLVNPTPVSRGTVPDSSMASHEHHHASQLSESKDDDDSRPYSTTVQPQEHLSWSPLPPDPVMNTSAVRLRPDPSFNTLILGKFGADDADRRNRQPAINTTQLGRSPSELEGGKTSSQPGPSANISYRAGLWPPESSSGSDPFAPPTFATDPSALRKPHAAPGTMTNTQRWPVFNPSHRPAFDQPSTFSGHSLGFTSMGSQELPRFDIGARSNTSFSPGSLSAQVIESNHHFNQQHLGSISFREDSYQNGTSLPHTGRSTWSSLQDPPPPHLGYDLSKQPQKVPETFGSLNVPNGMVPNQLKPHEVKPDSLDSRSSLPNKTLHDQHVLPPLAGRNSIVPNQLSFHVSKPRNRIATDHHFAKPVMSPSSTHQESSAGAPFNPKVDNDLRLAQLVARQADRDELAALQRMQDEWNREEDLREAKQRWFPQRFQNNRNGSHTQDYGYQQKQFPHSPVSPTKYSNPMLRQRPRRDSDDSIQFAASPDGDEPHPKVIVKPVKSRPIQPQRPAGRQNSNPDADAARRRERGEQETCARLKKEEEADRAAAAAAEKAKNQVECTVCRDSEDKAQMTTLPCNHVYHPLCLASAFQHALAGGKLFICCDRTAAPVDLAAAHLPVEFVINYKAKVVELSTPDPIYCAKPGCATFVPDRTGPLATCPKCGFVTCSLCRNPEHKGVCPPDKNGEKLLHLAHDRKWTQCGRCKAVIERDEGCLHMTCTCGHEFCYRCAAKWKNCKGACSR